MLRTRSRLMLALACAAIAVTQAVAQTAHAPAKISSVNGVTIPKELFDVMLRERTQQGVADNEQLHKGIIDELVNLELVVQDAARKGIGDSADVKAQVELARRVVIMRAYLLELLKTHPITDDAMKAEYERLKFQWGDKEYKARHILVEKEADAKDIIEKLKKGEKFGDLAKDSKDSGSRALGGDLGWNTPSSYVKPFADALVALGKGKFTETPVQSQYGWHVIRLDDLRPMKARPFEELKQRLLQGMQQQMINKALADLRTAAKFE